MRFFSLARYSTVTSTAALVIALAGTSYAAVVVTGKDIQNNTVTTKDIRDKTLRIKDFSAGATSGLKGPTGPAGPAGVAGPTGPAGATGPVGPIGPSDVDSLVDFRLHELTSGGDWMAGTSLLEPGSYLVLATVDAIRTTTGGRAWFRCELTARRTGAQSGDRDLSGADAPDVESADSNISMQIAYNSEGTQRANLFCLGERMRIVDIRLTVVKVGSVTREMLF